MAAKHLAMGYWVAASTLTQLREPDGAFLAVRQAGTSMPQVTPVDGLFGTHRVLGSRGRPLGLVIQLTCYSRGRGSVGVGASGGRGMDADPR